MTQEELQMLESMKMQLENTRMELEVCDALEKQAKARGEYAEMIVNGVSTDGEINAAYAKWHAAASNHDLLLATMRNRQLLQMKSLMEAQLSLIEDQIALMESGLVLPTPTQQAPGHVGRRANRFFGNKH